MEKCDLDNRATYVATNSLVDEARVKKSNEYINIAYTDYGGSFFDKVLISYFKKKYPKNIVFESTSWNGQNAFIFGGIVDKLIEETKEYILGFEDIENYYYNMEQKEYNKYIDGLIKDGLITESERDLAYEYLYESAQMETFGVDVDESRLIAFCKEHINSNS
jgi:hypothetical protein